MNSMKLLCGSTSVGQQSSEMGAADSSYAASRSMGRESEMGG